MALSTFCIVKILSQETVIRYVENLFNVLFYLAGSFFKIKERLLCKICVAAKTVRSLA